MPRALRPARDAEAEEAQTVGPESRRAVALSVQSELPPSIRTSPGARCGLSAAI